MFAVLLNATTCTQLLLSYGADYTLRTVSLVDFLTKWPKAAINFTNSDANKAYLLNNEYGEYTAFAIADILGYEGQKLLLMAQWATDD